MRAHTLVLTAAIALSAASPIMAQQRAQPAPRGSMTMTDVMIAMHCGGGPSGTMMHGGSPSGMSGMPSDTMMHRMMMRMMNIPTPSLILEHRQQLNLNPSQVSRLEAIQNQAGSACADDIRAGISEVVAANRLLESPTPDLAAYSTKVRDAASRIAEGHIDMAKGIVEARAVLTPAQRQTLNSLIAQMERGG